jgi:hypothetical protein
LVYEANGTVRAEVDPNGDGHFVVANPDTRIPSNPKSRIPNPEL